MLAAFTPSSAVRLIPTLFTSSPPHRVVPAFAVVGFNSPSLGATSSLTRFDGWCLSGVCIGGGWYVSSMDIGPTRHCWVVCVVHRLTWPLLIVGRCGLGAGSTFVWVDASVIGFWMALLVDTGCVKLDPRTIIHRALVFETPSWGHTRRCVRIPVVVFDQPRLGCIRRRWSWSCRGRYASLSPLMWLRVVSMGGKCG